MKTCEEFNRAVDLIEKVIVTDEQEEAYALWTEAIISAVSAKNQNQDDAESNYLVGYIFYKCPKKTAEIWQNAVLFLKRAIELSPSHQFAHYYLACIFFDQKNYQAAVVYLDNISADFFNSRGQPWYVVKANELRLCCDLYMNGKGDALNLAANILRLYYAFDDVLLAPLPTEFADCLEFVLKCKKTDESRIRGLCQICCSIFDYLSVLDIVADRWPLVWRRGKEGMTERKGEKGVSPKQ